MNRRIWVYIFLLAIILPANLNAQRWKLKRYEAAIGIGSVHTFMDIGSQNYSIRSFQFQDSRMNISSHIGYKLMQDLTVKLDLNYLIIGGVDDPDRGRELRFTSHCFEPALRAEYNLVGGGRAFSYSTLFNRRGMVNNYGSFFFYVYAGAGGILSKAKVVDFSGVEVNPDINPAYDNNFNWGFVIPVGLGVKRSMDAYFDFALEVGGRLTFTDLIDGYYNTVASQYNDRYITTTFKVIYKIRNDRRGLPVFSKYGRR